MAVNKKLKNIIDELKSHAPFTLFGALTGIVLMLVFRNLQPDTSEKFFYVFHPLHVILSAMVTASMFELHTKKRKFLIILLVGIVGSIGITTLSDSLIPYAGEMLLGIHIEGHAHGYAEESFVEKAHIGFIERWYLVIPAAILGVLIAFFRPKTKFPHAGHVLLSTWASSFHMLMALAGQLSTGKLICSFIFLFLAVWLPCCISDIVFPLLFVKDGEAIHHHH